MLCYFCEHNAIVCIAICWWHFRHQCVTIYYETRTLLDKQKRQVGSKIQHVVICFLRHKTNIVVIVDCFTNFSFQYWLIKIKTFSQDNCICSKNNKNFTASAPYVSYLLILRFGRCILFYFFTSDYLLKLNLINYFIQYRIVYVCVNASYLNRVVNLIGLECTH